MYRKIANGQYPITPAEIRQGHKSQVSFGPQITEALANHLGYELVVVDPQPDHDPDTHKVVAQTPAVVEGQWHQGWDVVPLSRAEVEARAASKAAEIDADFATACDAIRAGYPPDEILSWPQQQLEAEAWAADNAAPTPLLAAMASARGVPVPELATRILANVAAYKAAYGQALGERQRRQAELAAVDLEAEGAAEAIAAV